jgi:hypothetical protein
MLVKVLSFGTNWWARFGSDPNDDHRYTRHAAYYNSTGIRCGRKIRRHWIVPGLIRFNGAGGFNPHLPNRSIGRTFLASNLDFLFGGNRLLLKNKASGSSTPDCYIVVIAQDLHGRIDFVSPEWRSPTARVIAASQLRQMQESMLLMKPGDWVRTACGVWQLMLSSGSSIGAELELHGSRGLA